MDQQKSSTATELARRGKALISSATAFHVVFFVVPLAFLLVLVGLPIGFFVWSSVWSTTPGFGGQFTLAGYEIVLTNAAVRETLKNTLILAFFGTFVALAIGITATIFTLKMDLSRWVQSLVSALMIVQLLIPNFIQGLAWEFYLGPQGPINRLLVALPMVDGPVVGAHNIWTIAFIFGTHYAGLVYLLISGAVQSIPSHLEEIAMISGADRRTIFRNIDFRLILPSVLVSTVIVFVRGIQSFTLPLILGLPNQVYTLATLMYLELSEFPVNFTFVAALGVVILLVSIWLLAVQQRLSGRREQYETIRGAGEDTTTFRFYDSRVLGGSFLLVLFFAYILPILMIVIGSLQKSWVGLRWEFIEWSLEGYRTLFVGQWSELFYRSVTNAVLLGVLTAGLALVLAIMISYLSVKTEHRGGTLLGFLSYAPIAIPGIVLASALQWIIFEYSEILGVLYGSLLILVVAFTAKFLVYGVRATNSSLRSVGENLGEMGVVSGASRLSVVREIYAPLVAPGLLAGFILIVIDTTKSLSIPIILGGSQFRIVQSTIWFFITQSELNVAAAYSVLLIGGMTGVYMIAYRFDLDITSV